MKKLYTSGKWKAYSRKRQENELQRRRTRKLRLRQKRRGDLGIPRPQRKGRRSRIKEMTIAAPASFSFIEHPEEMLAFLEKIFAVSQKRLWQRGSVRRFVKVFIDMAQVKYLTPDAIPVLVSVVASRESPAITFGGNLPFDPALQEIFAQSGFYRHVSSTKKRQGDEQGSIHERKSYIVEADTARDLVKFATEKLYGKKVRKQGVQRVLIECMTNTRNHADPKEIHFKPWWASVYYWKEQRKVCFTFIDTGVGIFESLKKKGVLDVLKRVFKSTDNRQILREILQGKILSRTGLDYRGKGLPSIREVLERGLISNLIIISNDVYANISGGDSRIINPPFRGTMVYWELKR